MELLKKITQGLNINKDLCKLIFQEIEMPIKVDYNPITEYWYPHPPCLIPFFVGYGASYKGLINHFFFKRNNPFVEFNLEQNSIIEKSFNFNQLSIYLILEMIMIKDKLTNEIIEFAREINFREYEEVNNFSIRYGDNTEYFNELIYFKDNLPLDIVKDISTYKGDFPSSYDNLNENQIFNACSFEISPAAFEKIEDNPTLPKWLKKDSDKKKLFREYIKNKQFKEAWLTLNSKGWLLEDVANCLGELKHIVNDASYNLVADNWITGWNNSTFKNGNY